MMKLIALCMLVGVTVAMTTPTTTTTPTTMTTTMPTDEFMTMSENEMAQCPVKPFTANCTNSEYSDWMGTCMWYKGNFINRFKTIMTEAKNVGCMTPSTSMMKLMTKRLTEMMKSPFVEKLPEMPCGFCGRKMKCCNKGTNFWMQSYASESCDTSGVPCVIEPMTTTDFNYMREKYPTVTFNTETDMCNYDKMIMVAMKKFEMTKFYKTLKPLVCQMFGYTRPIVNCTMSEGKCMCCCGGFTWMNGKCMPMENFTTKYSEFMC